MATPVHQPQQWNVCTTQFQQLLLFKWPFLSRLVFQWALGFHFACVYAVLCPTVMHITRCFLRQKEFSVCSLCLHYYPTPWIGQYYRTNEMSDLPQMLSAMSTLSFLLPSDGKDSSFPLISGLGTKHHVSTRRQKWKQNVVWGL